MAYRFLTSPGTPDLWTRLGWLQGSTRNGMKWGALALLEISHSRGCYLKFAVLLVQRVCSPNDQIPKRDPGLCALVASTKHKTQTLFIMFTQLHRTEANSTSHQKMTQYYKEQLHHQWTSSRPMQPTQQLIMNHGDETSPQT